MSRASDAAGARSDSDESYDADFNFESNVGSRRYPVHDCCEFEDAESLRRLIFVRQEDSSEENSTTSSSSSSSSSSSNDESDRDENSDDDDDSEEAANEHAAAAAAAMGHSPAVAAHGQSGSISPTAAAAAGALVMESSADVKMEDTVGESSTKENKRTGGADGNKLGEAKGAANTATASSLDDKSSPLAKDSAVGKSASSSSTKDQIMEDVEKSSSADKEGKEEKKRSDGDVNDKPGAAAAPTETTGDGKGVQNSNVSDHLSSKKVENGTASEKGGERATKEVDKATSSHSPPKQQASEDDDLSSQGVKKDKKSKEEKKKKGMRAPKYYCPYDLDERDLDENTPLHIALLAHKLDCVRLLLEAGANVHRKCDGSAPVHTVISMGAIPAHANFAAECLAVLISHGADMAVKDESMHTPLYMAAMANLPRCASLILHDHTGMATLNMRSDRSGGRPLHACAKFDVRVTHAHHHRSVHDPHRHQGGHPSTNQSQGVSSGANASTAGTPLSSHPPHEPGGSATCRAILTRMLLSTPGIEVDPTNTYGRTPLHIAASRGNWPVARLLLQSGANPHAVDQRGLTPGAFAGKRGMVIPNDLVPQLGENQNSITQEKRDLIMDPDSNTVVLCHELCSRHKSCAPISRGGVDGGDPPPENVRRLHVLINPDTGILRSEEFQSCAWETEARRAAMADVLKVHEYTYVEKISHQCSSLPDHPSAIASLDPDTAVSHWSFEAALRAAGSVCEAVDKVMAGDHRNAFCAVRPPGHHAGPRGIVTCPNDPDGSHGFCLLNNVAVGAAYARSMYRNDGIQKVAIIDFDVHHGNGTEEIVRQLLPTIEMASVRTPIAIGSFQTSKYRPWLNEQDICDVFFASTHGYGPRDLRFADQPNQGGWFYPASGSTQVTDAVRNPASIEQHDTSDFLLTQTWARMGEVARNNCCKIIDIGLDLPRPSDVPGMQRVELRDAYRKTVLPYLMEFNPDMIFISAGFDAHKRDSMNFGYVGMIEEDYEWVTEQLVKVANSCCSGRIVSVLEGGYKIHGGIVSPFARSVASHVRGLVDGGSSREMYSAEDLVWESRFEHHVVEEKERKRQMKIDRLVAVEAERRRLRAAEVAQSANDRNMAEHSRVAGEPHEVDAMLQEPLHEGANAATPADGESSHPASDTNETNNVESGTPQRKRRRNQVDYKQLYEQMKKEEGFTG